MKHQRFILVGKKAKPTKFFWDSKKERKEAIEYAQKIKSKYLNLFNFFKQIKI